MLATGARRLINLWAVRPGERAVVFTANAEGDAAAALPALGETFRKGDAMLRATVVSAVMKIAPAAVAKLAHP